MRNPLFCLSRALFGLFFSVASFFSTSALSVEVTQLDESIVPVASRTTLERNVAIQAAFKNVILKNSGSKSALAQPLIAKSISRANSMMTQYGYQENQGALSLKVSFEHQAILNLLREAGLPVWGKQRPLTLVWLTDDKETITDIVSDTSSANVRKEFDLETKSKGLPVLFPVMDLQDSQAVTVNDIRGLFVDNVASASARYDADFFAIVTLRPIAQSYQYQVALFPKSTTQTQIQPSMRFSGSAENTDTAISEIVAKLSEYYVGQYATADTGNATTAQIAFSGISNMRDLVALEQYLKQLTAIKSVTLAEVSGDSVSFNLDLFGSETDLNRLLLLDPRVKLKNDFTEPSSSFIQPDHKTSHYLWLGK